MTPPPTRAEIAITTTSTDGRDFVKFHAVACMQGDFAFGPTESEEDIYAQQDTHYKSLDHTGYWHYTIERSRSRIVHPSKGHW